MMVDPHTQTQSTHRWEVLKANKIYPIATDDLLVRLWQENRLSSSTKIRRSGEEQWCDHDSINWSTFVAMVAESNIPTTSEDTEVESAETAEISITEESLRAEAALEKGNSIVAPAAPEAQVPTWWRDESPNSSTAQSRRSLVGLYAIAAIAIAACLVAVAILSSRSLLPGSSSQASALAAPTQPLPSADQPEPAVDVTSAADVNSEVAGSAATTDLASTENSPPPETQPQGEMFKPKAAGAPSLTPKDSPSPSQPPPVAAAAPTVDAEPIDRNVQDLLEKLKSSLAVYRETRKDIMKYRDEIKKSNAELQPALESKAHILLEAQTVQERIKQAVRDILVSQEFIRVNGGVASNNPVVQAEKIRMAASEKEILNAESHKAQLETLYRNIESREGNHANLVRSVSVQVDLIAKREVASLDKFLELMDFFGEKPIEYHRQVFEITDKLLHEEPDVFYAQVLNSAAAIQLQRYDVPRKNLVQMDAHLQSIAPGEYQLRLASINHFRALALGLAGLNDWRDGRRSTSIKLLDDALKHAPKLVELKLVRGMVGTDLKGINDGKSFFSSAAKTNPNDPRVYRVGLDSLLASRSPPTQMFPKLLENLLKVSLDDDEPSWLTAAETCIALSKPDEAQQYLKKVHSPMFEDRKQKLLAALK